MKKLIAISLLLACGVLASAAAAGDNASQQAGLVATTRDKVTVTGMKIRLGDLFNNTGAKADIIVADAPAAGMEQSFDVYRLAAIAQSHGLVWQARSWGEKVVIERAGQLVSEEQMLSTLRAEIAREMGAEGHFDVEVASRDLALTLPAEAAPVITVENLRVQRISGQFSATLVAAEAPARPRVSVSGRIHRIIEVPTLIRRMSAGDVIGKEDIEWVTMRTDRVGRNVVTDINRILGMTPTRTLIAGKALMNGEVRAPQIVAKNSIVIMLLKTPHMVLTSKGRALDHGAKGEVIKVMNTQSKTVIEGEVTASGTVEVSIANFAPLAMPQSASAVTTAGR